MTIYYIIFLVLAYFSLIENNKMNDRTLKIIVIGLTLFVGLRYNVGNDYAEYLNVYSIIKKGGMNYFEPLFTFLNIISPNGYIMFFLAATLSFFFLYHAFKYFYPEKAILLFTIYFGLYLILFNIHIVRQGIAIAIIVYAWRFAFEKKRIKYIILVLIAMGFHKSAIVALPVIFLSDKEIKLQIKMIAIFSSTISLIFYQYFKSYLFDILAHISLFERYAIVYANPENSQFMPISLGFLLNLSIFIFFELAVNKLGKFDNQKFQFIKNIFFISIIASILLRFSSIMLRLNYFYQISNLFMFGFLIDLFNENRVIKLLVLLIALLYLYMNLNTGYAILDYHTIFNS